MSDTVTTWGPNPRNVPPRLREGLERYRDLHVRTGGFLLAVLRNDLNDAITRADASSLAHLADIVAWLHEEMPSVAWGSPKAVSDWLGGPR